MKARLIINPISGTGSKRGLDRYVADALSPLGWELETTYTQCHGDATRLAAEAVDMDYDAVLAAGGDGTVNETAAALCGSRTALGIIPCGSGNGLARHLGIPIDVREGVKVIHDHQPHPIDYATVNGMKFFCTFGVGFDAAVSEKFAKQKRRGKLSYIRSAISEYVSYNPQVYTISANGKILTQKAFIVACCNASQYGNNAFIAPAASIRDGQLDVTIVYDGNILENAWTGVEMLTGSIGNHGKIRTFRIPALTVRRAAPGPAHIDGDPLHLPAELDIRCHPAAIRIFVPRRKLKFIPVITPMLLTFREWGIVISRLFRRKS